MLSIIAGPSRLPPGPAQTPIRLPCRSASIDRDRFARVSDRRLRPRPADRQQRVPDTGMVVACAHKLGGQRETVEGDAVGQRDHHVGLGDRRHGRGSGRSASRRGSRPSSGGRSAGSRRPPRRPRSVKRDPLLLPGDERALRIEHDLGVADPGEDRRKYFCSTKRFVACRSPPSSAGIRRGCPTPSATPPRSVSRGVRC